MKAAKRYGPAVLAGRSSISVAVAVTLLTCAVVVGTALGLSWDTARERVEDATRVLAWIAGAVTVAAAVWLWRRARA